jgi:hypothetical protein
MPLGTACASATDAIATEITKAIGSCTFVVRLGYGSYHPLAWDMACGPYAQVDEAKARTIANEATGFGLAGTLIGDGSDLFVFYESPGDFGGVAAVNAATGLPAFGGGIIWSGAGMISYPKSWRDVAGLGYPCEGAISDAPTAAGYDLVGGGKALDQAETDIATKVVWSTAIGRAIEKTHYVFDASVLLYPRTVGAFDPSTAEYVVLVTTGWLE